MKTFLPLFKLTILDYRVSNLEFRPQLRYTAYELVSFY